jgi:hypothetical protein
MDRITKPPSAHDLTIENAQILADGWVTWGVMSDDELDEQGPGLSPDDADALREWVIVRMADYANGSASADIVWTANDAGKADMASWVALDLFAGDDDRESLASARDLCEWAAGDDGEGWPS